MLLIDDEAVRTLEAFGYRVGSAADGAEGVAEYAQHSGDIAAVLTDMMMMMVKTAGNGTDGWSKPDFYGLGRSLAKKRKGRGFLRALDRWETEFRYTE